MASVFIDIPGVGNVEAKNAATEATLKEILKVMQGVQRNTKGKGGSGNAGSDTDSPRPRCPSVCRICKAALNTMAPR